MAIVLILSKQITNRDASPEVLTSSNVAGAKSVVAVAVAAVGTVDSSTSTYRVVSVPSNAVINKISIWNDASTGAAQACTVDLYDTTANGGAIVKSAFFCPAVSFNVAAGTIADCTYTVSAAGTHNYSNAEKMLWQSNSSVTVDTNKWYDIVLNSTVNNTTPGCNIVVKVEYTLG
jgi:hypothetical protein